MADANIIVAVDHAIDVIEYLFSVKQEASIREICQTVPFIVNCLL